MELKDLRQKIDIVDAELIELLEKRMDIAAEIAAYKRGAGAPVLDAAREAEKLAAVREKSRPETADCVVSVFESILAASRAYQTSLLQEASHDE